MEIGEREFYQIGMFQVVEHLVLVRIMKFCCGQAAHGNGCRSIYARKWRHSRRTIIFFRPNAAFLTVW